MEEKEKREHPPVKVSLETLVMIFDMVGYTPVLCPDCGRVVALPMDN